MTDVVAIFDREISELEQRLARARSLRREALREQRRRREAERAAYDAKTMEMWAWYMAEPDRTREDTARHFGIPLAGLQMRFWRRGLLAIGPHSQVKARRRAAKAAGEQRAAA